ncbi:uncharacterized protein LOC119673155 [Teleopsis dalmanni]|uniref:uncharacterized protein LOC119673155 n=1 Tax=Teleopsis dalmanni TaxID=139649 RepID=UPI0018CF3405|nr:uncharacterized protein LOC119673155 [Teleopsis dalmanni]
MFLRCVIGAAVIISIFGVVSINGLQCYSCYSYDPCNSPVLETCNQILANSTSSYLDLYFLNVNTSLISSSYNCLDSYIHNNSTNSTQFYKGCVYTSVDACNLKLKNEVNTYKSCNTCNKDACNNVSHMNVNILTVVSTVLLIGVAKFVLND